LTSSKKWTINPSKLKAQVFEGVLTDDSFDQYGYISFPTGTVVYIKHPKDGLPHTHLRPFHLFKLSTTSGKCLTRAILLAKNPELIILRPRKADGKCVSPKQEEQEAQEEQDLKKRYNIHSSVTISSFHEFSFIVCFLFYI
jgi:hypothetical protein